MPNSSYGYLTEAELIVSDSPMIKLIAQEMSTKDVVDEHKQRSTNLVAKLMGLDSFPQPQIDSASQRSRSLDDNSTDHMRGSKDVDEMKRSRDRSHRKGRYDGKKTEKQIDLVRNKFIEAKRLVTDEKLHGSKEFQDALEILSSNKDLFVEFSHHHHHHHHHHHYDNVSTHALKNRITVLRPSKTVETSENGSRWSRGADKELKVGPTRIVVLKPSHGNGFDITSVASSSPSPPRVSRGDSESRETAKEITRKMRENLVGPTALSNGYIGDESDYREGNTSDPEMMSPSSSLSSSSSSVCREARIRLYERWAMMSSPRQRHVPRNSNTLAEMLALSDTKSQIGIESSGDMSTSASDVPHPETSESKRSSKSSWNLLHNLFRNKKSNMRKPEESHSFEDRLSSDSLSRKHNEEEETTVNQTPFGEDGIIVLPEASGITRGPEMSPTPNLIGKSPLVRSIARTISLDNDDDSSSDITRRVTETSFRGDKDLYCFIEMMLKDSGYGGSLSSNPLLLRWHSPESPLDPLLRDKLADLCINDKELAHEANRRKQRSNRKLIFDYLNTIIVETTVMARTSGARRLDLVDYAWAQLKDWVLGSGSSRHNMVRTMDTSSSAAETVVRDEVVRGAWTDGLSFEMDDLAIEIERRLMQELIEEAIDLPHR